MKKFLRYAMALTVSLTTYRATAQDWQLVWQDEFNGSINPDWVFETGTGSNGWGNNELQYYRRENATVENGQLVITARREDVGGQRYTSARLKTQGKRSFRHGKIEARMAVPYGAGLWPAFWMLGDDISSVGWPACGEIDIMEHVNTEDKTYGTIHWQDQNGNYAQYGGDLTASVQGFHTYTIEWDERVIKWFFDGQPFHEVNIANGINGTSEFQNKFFLLLNLAVGGNWPGFDIDESRLPAQLRVDYVRVYQRGGGNGDGGSNALQREAEQYVDMSGVQTEPCSEGGLNVGYIDQGDWMAYGAFRFPRSGTYEFTYRVASPSGGALSSDLNGGEVVLGEVSVPATGGWQNWTTVRQTVYINAGTHNFGIYARQSGWNINWWSVRLVGNARTTKATAQLKTSVSAVDSADGLSSSIYPNPVGQQLNLAKNVLLPGSQMSIRDLSGKLIREKQTASSTTIDVSDLPPGIFVLTVEHQGQLTQHRFVKE